VIADHSRAATFLISDGVLPANDGRGYVLRKIIRRAITHGRLLGQTKPFLYEMVFAVRDLMQDAYPELKETAERVSKSCRWRKLGSPHDGVGLEKLAPSFAAERARRVQLRRGCVQALRHVRNAARLHAGCGPRSGNRFDRAGFDHAMEEQKTRARASWKGAAKQTANPAYQKLPKSKFEGYRQTRSDGCEVLAIIHNGQGAQEL
jgi:alanyl-tRNA synthetase